MKAVNAAGESEPSVALVVTVGQVPSAPGELQVSHRFSETSVELEWTAGAAIQDNLPTTAFRVYVDDLSGNAPEPLEVGTPRAVVSGLVLGHSYEVSVSAVNSVG